MPLPSVVNESIAPEEEFNERETEKAEKCWRWWHLSSSTLWRSSTPYLTTSEHYYSKCVKTFSGSTQILDSKHRSPVRDQGRSLGEVVGFKRWTRNILWSQKVRKYYNYYYYYYYNENLLKEERSQPEGTLIAKGEIIWATK